MDMGVPRSHRGSAMTALTGAAGVATPEEMAASGTAEGADVAGVAGVDEPMPSFSVSLSHVKWI